MIRRRMNARVCRTQINAKKTRASVAAKDSNHLAMDSKILSNIVGARGGGAGEVEGLGTEGLAEVVR